MKTVFIFALILVPCSSWFAVPTSDVIEVNGGKPCAACTILVGLIEQVAVVNNKTVTDMVSELCNFLPGEYTILCDILVHLWGPAIIEKLSRKESADIICYSLGICHVDRGLDYCHLFPEPPVSIL
ncbi:acyloxyacyl hydrolase-like [Stegodyphus dumicola]|uniref:acyloxyacyl hydrolase-like n=1 Tax=Stegodyphus dumicola TaxID=202533 RepID=UPI0015B11253|nr:acyloxyacyl hydrolase-like [Stegodyphus dumicola]